MGISVIEKSTPGARRLNPKLGLVLAGGAVTGGAFKLGGLKALDDYLANRRVVDFDVYVGLSAGAFLAAPLAAGITPTEMLATLEGDDEGGFGSFGLTDFYRPNLAELAWKPLEFAIDVLTYFPQVLAELLAKSPEIADRLREPSLACLEQPSARHIGWLVREILGALETRTPFPFVLNYLPSGLFDNRGLEHFIRTGFATRGLTNHFGALYRESGKELYIVAVNLDTAERVVFGHDEDSSLTISEAVQATTALPGFYRPARIRGVDYIDGGVRRTANIDVAIEHGADLIIAYNPFRPFNNALASPPRRGAGRTPLADHGMLAVFNQVLRTLLHSRLHLGLNRYREDPRFQGDIILIEPTDSDDTFFEMFPLNFWERRRAAEHGYLSVTASIDSHYEKLADILERYGLQVSRRAVDEGAERIREALLDAELRDAG